jgi:hypothetical protein
LSAHFDRQALDEIYGAHNDGASERGRHFGRIMSVAAHIAELEGATSPAALAELLERDVLQPVLGLIGALRVHAGMPESVEDLDAGRSSAEFDELAPDVDDVPFVGDRETEPSDERAVTIVYDRGAETERAVMAIDQVAGWKEALLQPGDTVPEAPEYVHGHHVHWIDLHGVASPAVSVFPCASPAQALRLVDYLKETGHFRMIGRSNEPPAIVPTQLRFLGKIPKEIS